MKYGVRQIANVVFRAKSEIKIGNVTFKKGQPVFYLDTAKTSSIEGAATTVYAQGGKGNPRLIAWEGEKTVTFTVEDALISPVSFAMLSGAGVVKGKGTSETDPDKQYVHFHQTSLTTVGTGGVIDLSDILGTDIICSSAPVFVMTVDKDGDLNGDKTWANVDSSVTVTVTTEGTSAGQILNLTDATDYVGKAVMVDYYVKKASNKITELQIDASSFAGSYYVEADTLWRDQIDGIDHPANITFPNVKIQSNFTFSMAASGDPSTFTFTMDAMPGYTYFNKTKKVIFAMQVVDEASNADKTWNTVFGHAGAETAGKAVN